MMRRHRLSCRLPALLLVVLALLLAGSLTVLAQDDISDDEVNEVAADLYCPVCESTPLDVCPTKACSDWRELIRTQLSEGASRQDVLDYFARQYGDGVLANPPRRGVSLIVLWIIPLLGIGLAAILFARFMRTMRTGSEPVTVGPPPPTITAPQPEKPRPSGTELDDYIARLEEELDE